MVPSWLIFSIVFLLILSYADVEVSVIVDGQEHTFRAGNTEAPSMVRERALSWCIKDLLVHDPGCALQISARIHDTQLEQQTMIASTRDILEEFVERLSNGDPIDAPTMITQLEDLCQKLALDEDSHLADAYYLLSVALRRLQGTRVLDARRALEKALGLTTGNAVQAWLREHASFLASVDIIEGSDNIDLDETTVAPATFDRLTNSLVRSIDWTADPSETVKEVESAVNLLVITSQRLLRSTTNRYNVYSVVGVGLAKALSILDAAEASNRENTRELRRLRKLRFLVLRLLVSVRPRHAATLFGRFVDQPFLEPPKTIELLWAAYAQLFPSYASTQESERSVARFLNFTGRAASQVTTHPVLGLGVGKDDGGGQTEGATLLGELPLVPHWRLGFSGPRGGELSRSLVDWSKAVLAIGAGPSGGSWRRNYLKHTTKANPKSNQLVAIGFVSSWFCNSAVGRLMLGLVRELDRTKFVVHLFHVHSLNGKLNNDETMTLDFNAAADKVHFVSLDVDGEGRSMTSAVASAVATVQSANIDFLVFCDIGMDPATYYLAFQRVAPIQVAFWGHPFTSGIPQSIDYYILPKGAEEAGSNAVPPHQSYDTFYRYEEQLVRFDTIGAFYDPVQDPNPSEKLHPSMLGPWKWVGSFQHRKSILTSMTSEAQVTFLDRSPIDVFSTHKHVLEATIYACPQHCGKFHPTFDDILIEILETDPKALLLLRDCSTDSSQRQVQSEFQKKSAYANFASVEVAPSFSTRLSQRKDWHKISSRILVIRSQLPLASFLRLLGAAHVALEPFPFPASITTLDAFTVGTPVISWGALYSRGMAQLSAGLYRRMMSMTGQSKASSPPSPIERGECCIARDEKHFVELATLVANNVNALRDRTSADIVRLSGLLFEDREAVKEWESFAESILSAKAKKEAVVGEELSTADANPLLADDPRRFLENYLQTVGETLGCNDTGAVNSTRERWLLNAADAWSNACLTLKDCANLKDETTKDNIASSLQEISGSLAWVFQVVQGASMQANTSTRFESILQDVASLIASGTEASLSLEPRLVNAALFGTIGWVHLKKWDNAAQLYATAAALKRPFFSLAPGDLEPRRGFDMPDQIDWEGSARRNPRSAAVRDLVGKMTHPGTVFDVPVDSGGSRLEADFQPFRWLQFGGYNSALVRHLASQLRHLVSGRSTLPIAFLEVAEELDVVGDMMDTQRGGRRYHDVDQGGLLPPDRAHVEIVPPSLEDSESSNDPHSFVPYRCLAVLGRTVYLRPTPALSSGALSADFFNRTKGEVAGAAEESTVAARTSVREFDAHGVAVLDEFLSKVALAELRSYCEDSTIYHKNYIQGYVGAFMGDGFGSAGLLHQLAAELLVAFPSILGNKRLVQGWSYKYDEDHERGIDPHSDTGSVSVNLWLTQDEANLDPDTGGLIIWPEPPPEDWSFGQSNLDTTAIRAHLNSKKFRYQPTPLGEWREAWKTAEETAQKAEVDNDDTLEVLRVPYRANRCIIFQSRLFHQTDTIRFKPGYLNRRINLTLLFQ